MSAAENLDPRGQQQRGDLRPVALQPKSWRETGIIEIGGRRIEVLDIRESAHRIRAAEILARGLVMVWNRATPGLIGDAYNREAAVTIQRVKGQDPEHFRGNVMSIRAKDVSRVVDTQQHHWAIRQVLEHWPDELVAREGGVFWNVHPRDEVIIDRSLPEVPVIEGGQDPRKRAWLTKPDVTSGRDTVVINVHNDQPMDALYENVIEAKNGRAFAIQGTSANFHGAEQPLSIEELDPRIFDDPGVALVILDASHLGDRPFAQTPSQFPIIDLTGRYAGGKEFDRMREGEYLPRKTMELLVGAHREVARRMPSMRRRHS